jgi:diguanylate cyclase (GGDEF)-like protein
MTAQFVLALAHALVAGSAAVVLGVLVGRGHAGRRPWLAATLIASFLYAAGYALELAGDSVGWVFASYRVQHLGIAFAPTLLLVMASLHGDLAFARRPAVRWVAVALSLATYAVVATNPWHGLYHANAAMDRTGPFPVITFDRGPWYVGFHAYMALALLAANVAFVRAWRRTVGPARARAATLVLASLLPWLGSAIYLAGASPWGVDTSPLFLVATAALLYRGIVRYALADVRPLARDEVVEQLGDAVLVFGADGREVDRNPAAAALVTALGADAAQRLAEPAARNAAGGWEVSVAGRTYDGREVVLAGRRGETLGRAVVLRDVTHQAELEATLRALATTDGLTGLANRRHFLALAERDVAQARRSGRSLALAIFDVDRFKAVNDTYGHHVGDDVLRALAATTLANVRAADTVGRYGGEEFAVLWHDTDAADVAAERLRASVADLRVPSGDAVVRVTISVGVAVGSGATLDLEALLRRADAAQYGAKQAGGDRVVVDPQPAVAPAPRCATAPETEPTPATVDGADVGGEAPVVQTRQ